MVDLGSIWGPSGFGPGSIQKRIAVVVSVRGRAGVDPGLI